MSRVLSGAVGDPSGMDRGGCRLRRLHRASEGERLSVAAHRGDRRFKDARSKSRFERARCTSRPNSVWRPTGATRKPENRWREAGSTGRRQPTRSASPGCANCLRGVMKWTQPRRTRLQSRARPDERIYVLTPQARVVELPRGGTPVDFAFHIHSEVGYRCRGARVDGAIVPLNTPLEQRPDGRDHLRQSRRAEPRLA